MTRMKLYLAKDPETGRISARPGEPFTRRDLPIGPDGNGWAFRETDIEDYVWKSMLLGIIPAAKQDELHLQWWEDGK
jgi:hypothetical protein